MTNLLHAGQLQEVIEEMLWLQCFLTIATMVGQDLTFFFCLLLFSVFPFGLLFCCGNNGLNKTNHTKKRTDCDNNNTLAWLCNQWFKSAANLVRRCVPDEYSWKLLLTSGHIASDKSLLNTLDLSRKKYYHTHMMSAQCSCAFDWYTGVVVWLCNET